MTRRNTLMTNEEWAASVAFALRMSAPFLTQDQGARLMNIRAEQLRQQGGVIRIPLPWGIKKDIP